LWAEQPDGREPKPAAVRRSIVSRGRIVAPLRLCGLDRRRGSSLVKERSSTMPHARWRAGLGLPGAALAAALLGILVGQRLANPLSPVPRASRW
jgi:hypothetical protein